MPQTNGSIFAGTCNSAFIDEGDCINSAKMSVSYCYSTGSWLVHFIYNDASVYGPSGYHCVVWGPCQAVYTSRVEQHVV